jgi:hypothetical protein
VHPASRADLQARGAVDRDAGAHRESSERTLDSGGAIQDLAALDIDLAGITEAGGWEVGTHAAFRYAEKIDASLSGMARVAAAAGRDESVSESGGKSNESLFRVRHPPGV